jgi:C-terminal processing protease CtpA/Prc
MYKTLLISFLTLLSVGCGSVANLDSRNNASSNFPTYEDTNSSSVTTLESSDFSSSDRSFILSLFQTEYLWYDYIDTSIDTSSYSDPNTMIDALRYKELDRWSYAETYAEYEAFANQQSSGSFGFRYFVGESFQIINVTLGSPAHQAGLQRGDKITHINDENISYDILLNAKNNLNVNALFRVERNGEYMNITMAPSVYTFEVTEYKVFLVSGKKVGWLRYDQFTSSSVDELDEAFNAFKEYNLDELIIDMRYNGGGSLTTASILMDKIAGYYHNEKVQFTLRHNDKLSAQDSGYSFEKDENSLSTLSRIFFLTTEESASASEVVINSLKPYIDVYTIGSTTHGKPVGMTGRTYGEYIYWLINFTIVNVNEEGEFYSGIEPTCEAEDNFDYPRDSASENMLKEAFYYISYGICLDNN